MSERIYPQEPFPGTFYWIEFMFLLALWIRSIVVISVKRFPQLLANGTDFLSSLPLLLNLL